MYITVMNAFSENSYKYNLMLYLIMLMTKKTPLTFANEVEVIFAITIAISTLLITTAPVTAQDQSPTALQQLKQHLYDAYIAAQNNDTLSVLTALNSANRSLFLAELQTLGTGNNNTVDDVGMTTRDISSSGQANNTYDLLTYENHMQGIKIKYPSDWQIQEQETGIIPFVVFYSPPGPIVPCSPSCSPTDPIPETFNIGIENLPSQTFTLERYTNLGINKLRTSMQDFNLTESEDTTIAGLPAHKITYTFTVEGESKTSNPLPSLKNMQIVTVKDGKAYFITYGGVINQFSESLADAQMMINSFEITNLVSMPTISAHGRIG